MSAPEPPQNPSDLAQLRRVATGRTAEVYALGSDRVAKVLRPGFPDSLGETEARAAERVTAAGLAAPALLGSTRFDGRFALVYERRDGPSMLEVVATRPWTYRRMAQQFAALHASMHLSAGAGLPPHRPQLLEAATRADVPTGVREATLRTLNALPDGTAVLHGDMHPGNVLLTSAGPAVIDWLTASSGRPAADVARTLYLLQDSALPPDASPVRRSFLALLRRSFAFAYLAAYRRLRPLGTDELRRWRLPILVARLGEGVALEEPRLRTLIEDEMRRY